MSKRNTVKHSEKSEKKNSITPQNATKILGKVCNGSIQKNATFKTCNGCSKLFSLTTAGKITPVMTDILRHQ